jgi:hypothetical protein
MAGRRKQDGTMDFEDTFKLAYKGMELALTKGARLLKDIDEVTSLWKYSSRFVDISQD